MNVVEAIVQNFAFDRPTALAPLNITNLIKELDNNSFAVSIPVTVIENAGKLGMKPNEWMVFSLIESYNKDQRDIPTIEEMATTLGMTRRNMQTIISNLKKNELLRTYVNGKKKVYDFTNFYTKLRYIHATEKGILIRK